VDSISSISSPAGEASHRSGLPVMTSDTQTSDSEPQAPGENPKGIRCPPHHWILGPPRYDELAAVEYTDQLCKHCGAKRTCAFEIPFKENSNEDATRRRLRFEND